MLHALLAVTLATTFDKIPSSGSGTAQNAAICDDGPVHDHLNGYFGLLRDQLRSHANSGLNADAAEEAQDIVSVGAAHRMRENAVVFRQANPPPQMLATKISNFKADAAEKRADGSPLFPEFADCDFTADSAIAGGAILARQLEGLWARALEQVSPELQGLRIFPQVGGYGPGTEYVRITRFLERGQAVVWAGGNEGIPQSQLKQAAHHVYFRYLVSSAAWSFFDQLAYDKARVDGVQRQLKTATKAVEQLHDQIIWFGSSAHGLYGVLNYPWLQTRMVATTFSSSADKDAMIREFTSLFNSVAETSNGAFMPTDLAVAQKLYNFLATTVYATTSGKTLLQVIQDGLDAVVGGIMPGRKVTIRSVPRLNDASGTGVHGVFAYQNDEDAIAVVTSSPTSMLPLRQQDTQLSQVVWKAVGGVVMPNVGANFLGYVTLA